MPNRPAGFITEAQVWKTHPNGYRYRILLLQQMLSIYYLRTKDYQFTKHGPSSTMDFSQNLHVWNWENPSLINWNWSSETNFQASIWSLPTQCQNPHIEQKVYNTELDSMVFFFEIKKIVQCCEGISISLRVSQFLFNSSDEPHLSIFLHWSIGLGHCIFVFSVSELSPFFSVCINIFPLAENLSSQDLEFKCGKKISKWTELVHFWQQYLDHQMQKKSFLSNMVSCSCQNVLNKHGHLSTVSTIPEIP